VTHIEIATPVPIWNWVVARARSNTTHWFSCV